MVKSMFAAVAGLRAHQTKMDVIGNNIANVNTNGFKCGRVVFQDVYYQTINGASGGGVNYGGGNASQVGFGSQISSIDNLMTPGNGAPTDQALDMMINNDGFFMVGPKNANGYANDDLESLNFTRVGNFKVDAEGYLVDANRNVVYGFAPAEPPATGVDKSKVMPIRFPQVAEFGTDGKYEYTGVTVGADGTISAIQTATYKKPEDMPTTPEEIVKDKPVTIGMVAVAKVPNPNGLVSADTGYYKMSDNSGNATAYEAKDGGTGSIKGGYLEMANVDLSKEFTEMITTQRGFQANSRIITVTDEMLQELVNLKR